MPTGVPVSDYGTTLSNGTGVAPYVYTVIANIVKIKPPEIVTTAVETTNHGSTGLREYLPSGLVGLSAMSITVNYESDDTLAAAVGVLGHYKITFTNAKTWTFDGIVTKFTPAQADAQKPGTQTADVEIQPTGANTIA